MGKGYDGKKEVEREGKAWSLLLLRWGSQLSVG